MTERDTTDTGDTQYGGASDKQKNYIGYLRTKLGDPKYKQILKDNNWGESLKINELSTEEASHVIEKLKENLPQEQQNNQGQNREEMETISSLIEKAHRKYKKLSVETSVLTPDENDPRGIKNLLEKGFVVRAEVTTEKGRYTAYGDATPENTTDRIQTALLRMAETRAIARALRWATAEQVAKEEIPEEESEEGK